MLQLNKYIKCIEYLTKYLGTSDFNPLYFNYYNWNNLILLMYSLYKKRFVTLFIAMFRVKYTEIQSELGNPMGNIHRLREYIVYHILLVPVLFVFLVKSGNITRQKNENLKSRKKIIRIRKLKRDDFLICMQTVTSIHLYTNAEFTFFVCCMKQDLMSQSTHGTLQIHSLESHSCFNHHPVTIHDSQINLVQSMKRFDELFRYMIYILKAIFHFYISETKLCHSFLKLFPLLVWIKVVSF